MKGHSTHLRRVRRRPRRAGRGAGRAGPARAAPDVRRRGRRRRLAAHVGGRAARDRPAGPGRAAARRHGLLPRRFHRSRVHRQRRQVDRHARQRKARRAGKVPAFGYTVAGHNQTFGMDETIVQGLPPTQAGQPAGILLIGVGISRFIGPPTPLQPFPLDPPPSGDLPRLSPWNQHHYDGRAPLPSTRKRELVQRWMDRRWAGFAAQQGGQLRRHPPDHRRRAGQGPEARAPRPAAQRRRRRPRAGQAARGDPGRLQRAREDARRPLPALHRVHRASQRGTSGTCTTCSSPATSAGRRGSPSSS